MAQPTTFSHPSIGTLKGTTTSNGKIFQFKGLQYATLTSRFAPPQLKQYIGNSPSTGDTGNTGPIDATTLGPQVLSIAPGPEAEFGLIQHDLPYNKDELSMSDTDGLCLNVTLPANTTPGAKLPVFVFIHGGGFMVGSAMWPQYDMASFVRLSVEAGTPVIAVAMNYRLGAPGLLYSQSSAWQSAGLKANNSLRDQRMALRWVQRYIPGFGGDPERVTLAGESAGGTSVCYQLFGEENLFSRVVSMSGTHLLLPPMTAEVAEGEFRKACKALNLEEGKEVEMLEGMDGQEMVGKLMAAGLRLGPVVDGDVVPNGFDWATFQAGELDMPGLQWCKGAMVGDCAFDGNIRGLDLMGRKKGIASSFHDSITSTFSSSNPELANRMLAAYSIAPDTPDDAAFEKVLQVANDLNFYAPTVILSKYLRTQHRQLSDQTFVYRFNTPNPWPGPWEGRATHILDISYLFQNFNDFLSDDDRGVARRFGEDVLAFVAGKAPGMGAEIGGDKAARVFGAGGEVNNVVDAPGKETGRRAVMFELAEVVGWDKLNEAFAAFARGG